MARAQRSFFPILLIACGVLCAPGRAATGQPASVTGISRSEFRAQVNASRQLVEACFNNASACDSRPLPGEEPVRPEPAGPGFRVSWQWLRDVLDGSAKASAPERRSAMEAARGHLQELAGQVSGGDPGTAATAEFPAAHAAAARVLANGEFRADAGPTWFDQQIARVQDALLRLFSGMGRVGARNPWLAPLLEWLCFGLAAAGLLVFLRRSLRRQALRFALTGGAPLAANAGLLSTDWIKGAEAAEARGDSREAIHCLYWAAVAGLETRRAWRPNPTRTPREYLRLLRPGSEAQRALQLLTRRFERTWYGSASAAPADVQAARGELAAIFAAVQAGELGRGAASGVYPGTPATAEGVAG